MSKNFDDALPPGSVIGILGGGQLGRMAAAAATDLGYLTHIYCPDPASPAAQVTDRFSAKAYDDETALATFAEAVDVVTFEFENVPGPTAAFLAERVAVRPGPKVLHICQNRLREKAFCAEIGVPTTEYAPVQNRDDLEKVMAAFSTPAVLKTTEMGYDGKGQVLLDGKIGPAEAWAGMAGGKTELEGIVEAYVDFQLEISVIVARSQGGEIQAYVPVENRHKNHILDQTIAPAEISTKVAAKAQEIAHTIAESIKLIGLLGIEMFVTQSGDVLVNELAPRPHNSGHWTMDACLISQFEQFIRAVTGLPLGDPERHSNAIMHNLIGEDASTWRNILSDPKAKLHLYGKSEARPGRKMGHVNKLSSKSD